MGWTSPNRTWIVGEIVTASQLNQYLRDQLAYLHGDDGSTALAGNLQVYGWLQVVAAYLSLSADNGQIVFGTASDVNLYRAAANQLKTDDALYVVGALGASWDGAAWGVLLGGGGHADGLGIGSDVNLYRAEANVLQTDDELRVAAVIRLLDAGASLVLGGDTNLYRSAANVLKTDDEFQAASVKSGGMYAMRALAAAHHVESGTRDFTLSQGQINYADISFADAFSGNPNPQIALTLYAAVDGTNAPAAPAYVWVSSISGSGFRLYIKNGTNGSLSCTVYWIAEGPD